jgi:hypothetical protein
MWVGQLSPLKWVKSSALLTPLTNRTLIKRMRYPKAGISPGWFNWGLEHFPSAFQHLPRSTKDGILRGRGSYGPAGAAWLRNRILDRVRLHERQNVEGIREVDDGVALTLSNNQTLRADHVILATGYRVDIQQLPMLRPSLLPTVQTYQHAPVLNSGFESSVPGLYFVGISSVSSCGPLYRFVVGTDAAAQRVTQAVTRSVMLK